MKKTLTIEDVAKMCHQANKAYCEALGDFSLVDWEHAPDWQRESCIKGVTLHIERPGLEPSHSHESWWIEKKNQGWVYGPKKCPEKKEHPCCVPFHMLPAHQQAKDHLFLGVVNSVRGRVA